MENVLFRGKCGRSWGASVRAKKQRKQNRHLISQLHAMTTLSMDVFVYILVFVRKKSCFGENNKIPAPGKRRRCFRSQKKTYPGRCRERFPKNVLFFFPLIGV
jgi:hypothetical protein